MNDQPNWPPPDPNWRPHPPREDARTVRFGPSPVSVTRALIAINAVVFVWTLVGNGGLSGGLGGSMVNQHQFDIALARVFIEQGEWWRIITSAFLHFGLLHIGMNMLLLWQLGQMIEPALGGPRFGLLYFAAMFGGAAGVIVVGGNGLTGGASGAVFGLMAAAAVGLEQRGVNPLRTGVGATLILNLLITFAIPGISIGGHLGGAIMGGAVGYAMLEPRWQRTVPAVSWIAPVVGMVVSVLVIRAVV